MSPEQLAAIALGTLALLLLYGWATGWGNVNDL